MSQPNDELYDLAWVIEDHLIDNCSLLEPADGDKTIASLVWEAIQKHLNEEDQ